MAPPALTSLDKNRAKAGEAVTLIGTGFGDATEDSAVHFRLPVTGSALVAAAVLEWEAEAVRVEVPPLESFGSAGPLRVSLTSADGRSGELDFLLLEAQRPSITTVVGPPRFEGDPPAADRGVEGDEIVITGARFGRQSAQSAIAFTAPGPRLVAAPLVSWTPTEVRARVPRRVDLGGTGSRPIVVRTPWGDSDPHPFLLGELPGITGFNPDQGRLRGVVVIEGSGFGETPGTVTLVAVLPGSFVVTLTPGRGQWTPDAITITLPGGVELGGTGPKDVRVRTEWGETPPARYVIQSFASVTVWHRLEPHARNDDLQEGLRLGTRAALDDAAWMLGRQWQMFEFQGEDAGSPVSVRIEGDTAPFARWRPGTAADVPVGPGTPLETLVERERVLPALGRPGGVIADLRLAAELGLQFLRNLGARLDDPRKLDNYRKRFLAEYGIAVPAGTALDAESRRFMAVAAGRAPDGARLYADLQVALGPNPSLPRKPPIDGNDRTAALDAIRDWYDWCAALFSEPAATQGSAWDPRRMEYHFGVTAGDAALDCPEHDGGHLDWYSFDRATAAVDGQATPFTRTVLPSVVAYPGMPAARWWEIEDATVDFGAVSVGASELLTLLFVEFGLAYGNDWFVVPVEGQAPGSLCRISVVEVTDAFGRTTALSPFGDGAGSDWRMFELTQPETEDAGDTLMIPDALPTTLASRPVEEVLFLRDELANLAWAVERVVESRTGRPLDRHQDEQDRRRRAELAAAGTAVAADGGSGPLRYVLQNVPPPNWYPLVPREGMGLLSRGILRDSTGRGIPPAGQLLEPGTPPPALDIFDEEVPRSGLRVVREWQLGRAPDGSTHLWRTRRKAPGRGEGSSGLRFDRIEPR